MKKIIFFLSMGVALTTQTIFAQVPSYVPTDGLVGYWPFNGNANDESGNGNNGTPNGTTLTTDRFGNANSAYSFDGLNDYIDCGNSSSVSTPTNFTFSVWINPSSITNNNPIPNENVILSKYAGLNGYIFSIFNEKGEIRIHNQMEDKRAITDVLTPNTWMNLVAVKDNLNLKIYLNNILIQNTDISTFNPNMISPTSLIFGKASWTSSPSEPGGNFNGKIDDICFWNRALSQQEISNIYNGVNYSDTCNAVSGSLVNGLVAYYPFCGNANDQSGNGLNGVVNGATLTTDRFGNSNSAYSFDGVNDFISTSYGGILGTNSRSISFWYNSSTNNVEETVFTDYGENNCGVGFACTLFPLNKPAVDNTCSWIKTVNSTTINNWNFYTVTHSSLDGSDLTNCKIYINGVLQSTSQSSTIYDINTINGLNMVFGSSRLFNPNQFFNGKIDDIGIWNRALTQQEITQLFNQNQCITNISVTDTLVINVGQLSYTNPITYANNIIIAPNPASSQININFNNITNLNGGTLKIINSLGQQVATTPITTSGTNSTMQLATWGGTGMYFVQIINPQGQIVDIKKIILQ